jgi:enoyl-CoA hydratase/carnithine racemase
MGRSMSAEDAKAAGLINAVVDSTALDATREKTTP